MGPSASNGYNAADGAGSESANLLASVGRLAGWFRHTMQNSRMKRRRPGRSGGERFLGPYSQQSAVLEALESLTPELRDALVLVTIEGLSYSKAADRLGVPVACLNSRIARARAAVAVKLGLLGEE